MPCLQYKKLKTKNAFGTRYSYIPCGECVDCRKKEQNAWKFRLVSEYSTLKKQGWRIGFITLTYNDRHLPHIPKKVFKDDREYREISCFSRSDVRGFIDSVRQYCKYHYGMVNGDNIRYFIVSEYGSVTKRPHYHMIIAWPPRMDYDEMHKLIVSRWKTKGKVFPEDYRGDAKTGCKSFEVVGDCTKVLSYVSKYVCKDLDWHASFKGVELNYGMKLYKGCKNFHIQSVSLGYAAIKDMSDEEKRDVYINGMSFQGDGEIYQVPMYIKNKLVYDNYYVLDEKGERMVKRKASAFFEKYRNEIFEKKAEFYTKMFKEASDSQYYIDRGVDREMAEKFADGISYYRSILDGDVDAHGSDGSLFDTNLIGELYLAYYGVKFTSCYIAKDSKDLCEQWMCRYRQESEVNKYTRTRKLCEGVDLRALNDFCSLILGCMCWCNISKIEERTKDEERINKIRDFYKNNLMRYGVM